MQLQRAVLQHTLQHTSHTDVQYLALCHSAADTRIFSARHCNAHCTYNNSHCSTYHILTYISPLSCKYAQLQRTATGWRVQDTMCCSVCCSVCCIVTNIIALTHLEQYHSAANTRNISARHCNTRYSHRNLHCNTRCSHSKPHCNTYHILTYILATQPQTCATSAHGNGLEGP